MADEARDVFDGYAGVREYGDEALMELALNVDVIVLAQLSMARVAATLEPGALSVPVLSSPGSGMARLASLLVWAASPQVR